MDIFAPAVYIKAQPGSTETCPAPKSPPAPETPPAIELAMQITISEAAISHIRKQGGRAAIDLLQHDA